MNGVFPDMAVPFLGTGDCIGHNGTRQGQRPWKRNGLASHNSGDLGLNWLTHKHGVDLGYSCRSGVLVRGGVYRAGDGDGDSHGVAVELGGEDLWRQGGSGMNRERIGGGCGDSQQGSGSLGAAGTRAR